MTRCRVRVEDESDIAAAARCARQLAEMIGLTGVQVSYVATAASELAANLFVHGGGGVFEARALAPRAGLELEACDQGPGIADVALAMREGYSTAGSLGCGLPGVQRLMDELEIDSRVGIGTRVRARKWC